MSIFEIIYVVLAIAVVAIASAGVMLSLYILSTKNDNISIMSVLKNDNQTAPLNDLTDDELMDIICDGDMPFKMRKKAEDLLFVRNGAVTIGQVKGHTKNEKNAKKKKKSQRVPK